jgi:hypothetical protein
MFAHDGSATPVIFCCRYIDSNGISSDGCESRIAKFTVVGCSATADVCETWHSLSPGPVHPGSALLDIGRWLCQCIGWTYGEVHWICAEPVYVFIPL